MDNPDRFVQLWTAGIGAEGTSFALTNLLLPLLLATPGARVATMSSGAANLGRIDFADLNWRSRRYSAARAYA